MRSLAPIGVIGLFVFAASVADAATITGTVTGPDGTRCGPRSSRPAMPS